MLNPDTAFFSSLQFVQLEHARITYNIFRTDNYQFAMAKAIFTLLHLKGELIWRKFRHKKYLRLKHAKKYSIIDFSSDP